MSMLLVIGCGAGCGGEAKLVAVSVLGADQAASLAVAADLDGQPLSGGASVATSARSFVVRIPETDMGSLRLQIRALDRTTPDACWIAAGAASVLLTSEAHYDAEVALQPFFAGTAAPLSACTVWLDIDGPAGSGAVSVQGTSDMPACPSSCTTQVRPQQTVTLVASASPGYTFVGWSGACYGLGTCNLQGQNSELPVRATATFTPSQLCTRDGASRWCWENPLPRGSGDLKAVWGASAHDQWAVGDYGTVLHYNGGAWLPVAIGTKLALNAVWGSSADAVWIVGDRGAIWHFDGQQLAPVPSPVQGDLLAVWGRGGDQVFIAGRDGVLLTGSQASGFSRVLPVSPLWTGEDLTALWGSNAQDVWLLGQSQDLLTRPHAVYHFDGGSWTQVMSSAAVPKSIGGTGSGPLWLASQDASGKTLVFSWNGLSWSQVSSIDDTVSTLWVSSATEVWLLGARLLYRLRGQTLTPEAANPVQRLGGAWGGQPNDVWAVGNAGQTLHWDGVEWSYEAFRQRRRLNTLVATASGSVLAFGEDGAALSADGSFIAPFQPGLPLDWNAAWKSPGASGKFYLAAREVVVALDSSLSTPQVDWAGMQGLDRLSIWGTADTNIYVVGEQGSILHKTGSGWRVELAGTASTLRAVWGSSAGDVWAAGDDNTILHSTGAGSWTAVAISPPPSTAVSLYAIAGTGSSDVWLVGRGGTVLHAQSPAAASDLSSVFGVTDDLVALWVAGPQALWLAGGTTVYHGDGTSALRPALTGATLPIRSLWGNTDGPQFIAGDGGMLLHRDLVMQ